MQQSNYLQSPFGAMRHVATRLRISISLPLLCVITILALGLSSPSAHAQDYNNNTLYTFNDSTGTDGANSLAHMINVNRTFYGTTAFGGLNSTGTVFSFNPTTNIEKTLYTFTNANGDGEQPYASLVYDSTSGKLFGTTSAGGSAQDGTIFSINTDGTGYQVLYSFKGSAHSNGQAPIASMIDVNGTLYGTTQFGGTGGSGNGGFGTIFSFNTTTDVLTTLHSFTGFDNQGTDGYDPTTDLIYDSTSGKLYGTTEAGGDFGGDSGGTIFSINTNGSGYQILHDFVTGNTDGSDPRTGLTNLNGTFYGTTTQGGANGVGTVFSFNPTTNTETTLYSFTGDPSKNNEGEYPVGDLAYDSATGKFFGTTYQGGNYASDNASLGSGTAFTFDPSTNTEKTIYRFSAPNSSEGPNPDGTYPWGGLLDVNGILYGTTYFGGNYGYGVIYSLTATTFTLPKVGNDKYTVRYNNTFAIKAPGVMANDNLGGSNRTTATLVTNVTHGSLTFNADGSFTYVPNTGFVGNDTFTYYDTNPLGKSNTGTVTLAVTAVVPIAYNDGYGPKYNTTYSVRNPGVLANDYTGENVTLTATLVTSVSHGTLTFHSDGSFIYKPNLGFAGTDTFTYYATNPIGNSNTATVSLIVSPTNPIAYNDTYTVKYQTAFAVQKPGVLANDDTGGVTPMTAVLNSNPTNGTLTFNTDGSFTYKPNAGFTGTDSFTYFASTSVGTSTNPATVTLNVPATVPIAANDTYSVKHNTAFHVNAPGVLANDGTGGRTPLTANLVSNPTHGTLTLSSDGSFTYTPTTGFSGADTFTYTASNSVGTSNTATVTLNVQ